MKKRIYFCAIIFLVCIYSCGKDFGDINSDPNNPQIVPPEVLLTNCEKILADNVFQNSALPEVLSQTWAQSNYTDISRYDIRPQDQNGWFQSIYSVTLKDLERIVNIVHNKPGLKLAEDNNKIAIATVLRAYTFEYVSDIFGAVPYKDALEGANNRAPKYDSMRVIYLGIIGELKTAISMMDATYDSYGGADIIYNGDVAKWKKFAHSLILRIAMRMSDVEAKISQTEIENGYQNAFNSNNDNANFKYLNSTPNNNPIFQIWLSRGVAVLCLSDVLIDSTLKPLNDPRLYVWADERAQGGGYFGRPYGQNSNVAASQGSQLYSLPSGAAILNQGRSDFKPYDVLRPDANACLMNYAEVCFILAEAKERGWNVGGSAEQWYNEGIRASMKEWGITDATTIDSYLAQPTINYNLATGDWKQKIGVQKWLALFMQGIQAWSEWRRLDFKKFILPVGGSINFDDTKIAPLRLIYPSDEQSLNSANYQNAVLMLGGPGFDKLTTRLWWDVK